MKILPQLYGSNGYGDMLMISAVDYKWEDGEIVAPKRLREIVRILMEDPGLGGFYVRWCDEDEEFSVPVMKGVLLMGLDAGGKMFADDLEAGAEEALAAKERRGKRSMKVARPMDAGEFDELAERIRSFERNTDGFLRMELLHDEDMSGIRVFRTETEGERHIDLVYDMSDFDWDHPLALGGELPTEEAIGVLRRILVDGESAERIDAVCSGFRDISDSTEKETTGRNSDDE